MKSPLIRLQGVSKTFGEVQANKNVNIDIFDTEILGLIGENGAGKSTIMKILYGFYEPDEGEIYVRDQKLRISTPLQAIQRGIGMVHQHFMLVHNLTVLENIILGQEPTKAFQIDTQQSTSDIEKIIKEYGIDLPLHKKINELSVGQQQQVEIIKVLYRKANILILDEPTAVLTPQETQKLFQVLINLKNQGKAIVLITHKMKEILSVTDRVVIFRKGEVIKTLVTKETNENELAQLMVGRELQQTYSKSSFPKSNVVVSLENVGVHTKNENKKILDDVSFQIYSHEIVGIAGIMGNGQTELEEVLSGLRPCNQGKIHLFSERIDGLTNQQIRKMGVRMYLNHKPMGHVPEDRQEMGLILSFSVKDNFLLGHQYDREFNNGLFINDTYLKQYATDMIQKYAISPPDDSIPARNLSGGNQQKIIIGRELDAKPSFALISQPTRGVDIGAIEAIHAKILDLRNNGSAILLISADIDEILKLSDRVLILFDGKIAGEVIPSDTNMETLGLFMTGHTQ